MLLNKIGKFTLLVAVIILSSFTESNSVKINFESQENGRAIVLDPFNSEFNSLSLDVYEMYMRSIIYNLERAGYTVDYYKDENVTINLLKRLDDEGYSIIYINSHGFIDPQGFYGLFINEKIDTEKANLYQSDLEEKSIRCLEDGSLAGYLYVTPQFFSLYGNNSLSPDALIFIDACHSGNNTSLAEVFLNLGAQCFIGWNGPVNVIHGIMMDGKFFHEACKYNKTVEQALRGTRADPDSGATLTYFGNGTLRILRVAQILDEDRIPFDTILKITVASIFSAGIIYAGIRVFLSRKSRLTLRGKVASRPLRFCS
ncbi:hypothetical protein KEJ34_01110 [Candidatus Bathyarchaeota archaeon]|nr:hypothetical protein [Candidatus Bathyarchaeota archaeon]